MTLSSNAIRSDERHESENQTIFVFDNLVSPNRNDLMASSSNLLNANNSSDTNQTTRPADQQPLSHDSPHTTPFPWLLAPRLTLPRSRGAVRLLNLATTRALDFRCLRLDGG